MNDAAPLTADLGARTPSVRYTMNPLRVRVGLILVALLIPTAGLAITLDAVSDPFPPNPCLPNSGARVVFVGSFCDGVTCPPDPPATCEQDFAIQTGLPGVYAGSYREASVAWESGPIDVSARLRDDLHAIEVTSGGGHSHRVHLQYGDFSANMNLDLTTLGVTEVVMEFGGDVSPSLPLRCSVQMYTLAGPSYYAGCDLTLPVTQSGPLAFPLDQFQAILGFSFADVDMIQIDVGECPGQFCEAPATVRAYTIGPIRGEAGVVANRATTWGRLKSVYR